MKLKKTILSIFLTISIFFTVLGSIQTFFSIVVLKDPYPKSFQPKTILQRAVDDHLSDYLESSTFIELLKKNEPIKIGFDDYIILIPAEVVINQKPIIEKQEVLITKQNYLSLDGINPEHIDVQQSELIEVFNDNVILPNGISLFDYVTSNQLNYYQTLSKFLWQYDRITTLYNDYKYKRTNFVIDSNSEFSQSNLLMFGQLENGMGYGINMNFPVQDSLSLGYHLAKVIYSFNGLQFGLLAILPAFICFILLHLDIEKNPNYKPSLAAEILFLTQLLALFLLFIFFGNIVNIVGRYYSNLFQQYLLTHQNVLVAMIGFGLFVTIYGLMVLSFYFQWVKRIKNKQFLDSFLIVKVLRIVKKTFTHARKRVQLVLLSIAIIFVLAFLIGFGFFTHGIFGPLLLLVAMIGFVFLILKVASDFEAIQLALDKIAHGQLETRLDLADITFFNQPLAKHVNKVAQGLQQAVDEQIKGERLKAQLITNVSHDLKNPLTSLITYVDLIKKEDLNNPTISEYLNIIERKTLQLKTLTEDVLEVSKLHSGNVNITCTNLNFQELIDQCLADFKEKFEQANLELIVDLDDKPSVIYADANAMVRVIDNLFSNVLKYSSPHSRVYCTQRQNQFTIKNISKDQLNIDASQLLERFVRNDDSRHLPGSGLGLSIANELMKQQHGDLEITIDGDLFKVTITLPKVSQPTL